jgi:putative membrane protein insertion efficiency factor
MAFSSACAPRMARPFFRDVAARAASVSRCSSHAVAALPGCRDSMRNSAAFGLRGNDHRLRIRAVLSQTRADRQAARVCSHLRTRSQAAFALLRFVRSQERTWTSAAGHHGDAKAGKGSRPESAEAMGARNLAAAADSPGPGEAIVGCGDQRQGGRTRGRIFRIRGRSRTGAATRPQRGDASAVIRSALLFLLGAYKRVLSPLLPPACRFEPTCSIYAMNAISKYGAGRGGWLAVRRLLRCHPFHPGGFDPVP